MSAKVDDQLVAMERILKTYLGPIGPITLNTQIRNMGLTREQLSEDHVDLLVEQIGDAVSALIGDAMGRNVIEKINGALQQQERGQPKEDDGIE